MEIAEGTLFMYTWANDNHLYPILFLPFQYGIFNVNGNTSLCSNTQVKPKQAHEPLQI